MLCLLTPSSVQIIVFHEAPPVFRMAKPRKIQDFLTTTPDFNPIPIQDYKRISYADPTLAFYEPIP
jgi:hypothetical protein